MTEAIKINQNDGKTRNVMTGGETEVDFDFPIYAATHLTVYETDTNGDITLLVKDTDYTVPAGSVNQQAGGTIDLDATQYPSGATAGHVFTVYQAAPEERTTDFTAGGDFFADTLNKELDLITQQLQQLRRDLNRSPLAPVDTTLSSISLPDQVNGSVLIWDDPATAAGAIINATVASLSASVDIVLTGLASGDLLRYNGTNWVNVTQLDTSNIVDAAIETAKINDLAVSTAKIADDAVTDAKIRLTNDGFLTARNNAGSADINLFKVNTSDVIETGAALHLGADLNVGSSSIVSSSNGDINITPNGTGSVVIDGISYPQADGTNGQALVTDGAGQLSFSSVGGAFEGELLHVRDEKATTTQGGNSSTGANTRDLNTVLTNEITGASLASNQITLPVGTYYIEASAPAYGNGNNHRAYLYNVDDASIEVLGVNGRTESGSSDDHTTHSFVYGRFTIAAEKDFELRHYHSTGNTNGFGRAVNDGEVEVYTDVRIWKVG